MKKISPRQRFLCHLGKAKISSRYAENGDLEEEQRRKALKFAYSQALLAQTEQPEDPIFPGFINMLEEKLSLPPRKSKFTLADFIVRTGQH